MCQQVGTVAGVVKGGAPWAVAQKQTPSCTGGFHMARGLGQGEMNPTADAYHDSSKATGADRPIGFASVALLEGR